ncbi:glycerophosphodiester phosphodiesterase [Tundrisphaera lichenicola]|uniref:glycerophosphodiester phosphodiesterase n=1 Tax=Tundrisphaera lichenicola TaxID=2029860 RepID=UPI003EB6FA17
MLDLSRFLAFRAFFLLGLVPSLVLGGDPVVIAHRGASGYLPEHTLEAVAFAHAQGADYIEQDVVLSKDGVPVVLHDTQVDTVTDVARKFPERRRADGRYYAIDFTLAELKTLDVRERVNPKTGEPAFPKRFPSRAVPFRIPTLDEELELIAGLNASTGRTAGVYAEIKSPAWHKEQGQDLSPIVLATLARHGYSSKEDPCYVQCFDFDEVKRVREELGYRGRLVQLIGGRRGPDGSDPTSAEGLASLAKYVDGIGPAIPLVVRTSDDGKLAPTDLVRLAHEANLVVHPYTIRVDALPNGLTSETLFEVLFDDAKIDGVFADHPDKVVDFLRARGKTR